MAADVSVDFFLLLLLEEEGDEEDEDGRLQSFMRGLLPEFNTC